MALTARLLGRYTFACQGARPCLTLQYRPIVIKARPAAAPIEEGHDERNMRLGRPQSPHLTIYKPQLTSMLSITHRMTGLILGGYAGAFAVVSLLSSKPMGQIIQNLSHCNPEFLFVFKLGLLFPFTYHFFNGIRHLVWDTGSALSIKAVYITGYIMLVASIATAVGIIYYAEELKEIERKAEARRKELQRLAEEAQKKGKPKKKKDSKH